MRASRQTGKRTPVRQAEDDSAVVIGPVKNCAAGSSAEATPSRQTMVAPRVTATSAISAAGSALASDPPSVPRLRIGAWPTNGMTLASSGMCVRTSPSRSSTHCRVVAPIATASPSLRTKASSPMRAMSISRFGRASRIAISGTSVWPPAMRRASSPPAESIAQASSRFAGREYSNAAGFINRLFYQDRAHAEAVIHADLHDVQALPNIGVQVNARDRVVEVKGVISQIHVIVFELRGPIVREGIFDAQPHHPAPPGFVGAEEELPKRGNDHLVVVVGPRRAALAVEQKAIERHAQPGGGGAERIDLGRAAPGSDDDRGWHCRRRAGGAAGQARPARLRLETEHPRLKLIIRSDLSAGKPAAWREARRQRHDGPGPGEKKRYGGLVDMPRGSADMNAGVDTGPSKHHDRRAHGVFDRQVGGGCREHRGGGERHC